VRSSLDFYLVKRCFCLIIITDLEYLIRFGYVMYAFAVPPKAAKIATGKAEDDMR